MQNLEAKLTNSFLIINFILTKSLHSKAFGLVNVVLSLFHSDSNYTCILVGFYFVICLTGILHNKEKTISSHFHLKSHGFNLPKFVRNIFKKYYFQNHFSDMAVLCNQHSQHKSVSARHLVVGNFVEIMK